MTDLQLDTTNGDLLFTNGDLTYGESTRQHQRDILLAKPGDYLHAPDSTVGINKYAKEDDPDEMLADILVKFRKDGMNVKQMIYEHGLLKIEAPYGR